MFFEISTSNFQEMFLDLFRKFWKKIFKKKKKITKVNKKTILKYINYKNYIIILNGLRIKTLDLKKIFKLA